MIAALLLAQAMPGMAMPDTATSPPTAPKQPAGLPPAAPVEAAPKPGAPMPGMAMGDRPIATMQMGMGDGAYEAGSGTSRLPAGEGPMRGLMIPAGGWMLMAHGYVWAIATHQAGPRGDDDVFATSMAMLMADRDLSDRVHLQLKAMLSLDPLLGARGYPDLFATGEVAAGQPLIDRQHPHDLTMELAARADYRIGGERSLFLYGGPVAEPALGPAAFMHRGSARYLPLAPISHHWFDSTHITYGVLTGGYADGAVQLEASGFRGREPDEHRWDIERPALDSWSARASWTPSPHWALQASIGHLHSPEAQEPLADERRTTATVNYATGGFTVLLGYAVKDKQPGRALPAWIGEGSWEIGRHHALFGRLEYVKNDELFPDLADPRHDRPYKVMKAEGGYAYRLPLAGPLGIALGGTLAGYAKPAVLDSAYGTAPVSWTLFSKLALGL